ncbi:MAG: hypothetical protein K2Y32_00405 [Candidatus Obscuribacterales bacterium]|nr:hypothetical protein [Candidatus Obscuribacterales bacterium]
MNLLVTGSREYKNLDLVEAVLYAFIAPNRPGEKRVPAEMLFVGDAKGVDREAARTWEEVRKSKPRVFRAKWAEHGDAAGPIRNTEMLKAFKEAGGGICFAFWNGKSRGTLDMMRKILAGGQGVFLPEGFLRVDLARGTGDLKVHYLRHQEDLENLITDMRAQRN